MTAFSFRTAPKRQPLGDAVPMINVGFLLLVFFLLAARIAPPDPVEVTLPEAASEDAPAGDLPLFAAADGTLARGGLRGEAVLAALAADPPDTLVLRADRALDGAALADLLVRLRGAGVGSVSLAVAPPQ